tara:strand:- start:1103 stop:1531 length:429 start_codon:yes stop_codon:yes gene_type:complete
MILYNLKCTNGHNFNSWFASAETFDKLSELGQLSCEVCGCSEIKKDLMSPRLQSESKNKKFKKNMLVKPHSEAEKILKDFKEKIEKNSENVGRNFAKIAREIHEGDAPERSIIGEATPKETLELIEDEIPVTPLPWFNRKSH